MNREQEKWVLDIRRFAKEGRTWCTSIDITDIPSFLIQHDVVQSSTGVKWGHGLCVLYLNASFTGGVCAWGDCYCCYDKCVDWNTPVRGWRSVISHRIRSPHLGSVVFVWKYFIWIFCLFVFCTFFGAEETCFYLWFNLSCQHLNL